MTKALLKPRIEGEKPGSVTAAVGYNEISDKAPNFAGRGYAPKQTDLLGRTLDLKGRKDPQTNITSKYYDASKDPALNAAINLGR